ncbi:MAG: hypothetical protein ACRC3Y_13815 [Romboutsia sp.]|uniref:hypothetical protein n=1 Tax=Romboutsia sp. TaxID=1965302 RepID=UPI003F2E4719
MASNKSCQNPCSCGCSTTYIPQQECCSPSEYNPISVSTCPTVQGGSGGPSNATGGNNSVSLNVSGGCCCTPQINQCSSQECCCKDGMKSVLLYLQSLALDALSTNNTSEEINLLSIFGNIANGTNDFNALVSTTSNDDVVNSYFTNDLVYINSQAISLCAISYIKFSVGTTDADALSLQVKLKREFDNYLPGCNCGCSCSCDCNGGIADYLFNKRFISGANVTITLDNVFSFSGNLTSGYSLTNYSIIGNIVALNSCFVIIRNTNTPNTTTNDFFAISLCNISKIV